MTYSSEVLADTPLVYLRLGDASGTTAADTSGNSRPGTYVSSPTLGVAGALAGDADTAVTFNGSTQYASIAGAAWMNVADYSIEFWFKATTASASTLVIVNRDDSSTKLWDAIMVSGKLRFQTFTGAGSAETTDSTNTYNDGNWHHCVMTKSGTAKKIYVDGVQDGSGTGTTFGTSSTLIMNLARRSNNTLFWPGTLDEFAFYTGALSSARVSAHYSAGTAAAFSGTAAAAVTASTSAAGGAAGGATTQAVTTTVTSAGSRGVSTGASPTATVTLTAAGSTGLATTANGAAATATTTATGSTGIATLAADTTVTVTLTASGAVGVVYTGAAQLDITATVNADSQTENTGSIGATVSITASGVVDTSGDATDTTVTVSIAAAGMVHRSEVTPPERLYTVAARTRSYVVTARDRTVTVTARDRTYTVPDRR